MDEIPIHLVTPTPPPPFRGRSFLGISAVVGQPPYGDLCKQLIEIDYDNDNDHEYCRFQLRG